MTKQEFKNIVVFYGMCFKRAWSDTLAFLGQNWRAILNLAVPAVIGIAVLRTILTPSEVHDFSFYLKTCYAAFVGSVIWGLAIYFGKLLAAPYRVRMERFTDQSFQLIFGQGGPFVQSLDAPWTLYRLGVMNTTADSIEGVFVEVTDIQPDAPNFLPLRLHMMHDNPPQHQSFTLDSDYTQFVDIVAISNGQGGPQFQLQHIVAGVANDNLLGPASQLTITARAPGHSPEVRTFAIANDDGVFRLVSV
jgi:hypothetical protein